MDATFRFLHAAKAEVSMKLRDQSLGMHRKDSSSQKVHNRYW